jgi:RNA polymerase sigma factor (TIGR02999 family)
MDEAEQVVRLLAEWQAGDPSAYDRLIPLVYQELRRLARAQLRREGKGHSFQATTLVHEAYLRLAGANIDWQCRAHFLSVAARVMRRILVERARSNRAGKRGGDTVRVTLTSRLPARLADPIDVLQLDAALGALQALDARQAQVVELCYFGGLTQLEIGRVLAISPATVERDLRHARAWLRRELSSPQAVE